MKAIILLITLFSSTLVFAEDSGKQEMFQKVKTMALTGMDKRMEGLQKAKNCILSAQNRSELKMCRQKAKELRKQLRAQFKENRKELKQEMAAFRKNKQKSEF